MNNNSDVSTYVDFFRQLAVSHKDLQHNPDSETGDAPIGSQRFTKISVEEVLKGLRSKVGFPCLCLELFETETDAAIEFDIKQRPRGAFMVIDHPANSTFKAEEDCYVTSERIVKDLLRQTWQLHYGKDVDRNNTPFKEFSFDKLSITAVGPVFNNEFGYRVEFDFELHNTTDLATPPDPGTFL